MVTKADLLFVRDFVTKEKELRDQLEKLRERVDVHSVQYDKILAKGGEERDRFAEHAVRVDEMERRYADLYNEYRMRYLKILEEISKLPGNEMRVIRLRYQERHSWKWIRRTMHYSEREVFKIHGSALRHLAE